MDRNEVIETLTTYFCEANCSDRALMREWVMFGANLPGFANMCNDELAAEWLRMFDETITIN